jgi:hypothetical protein
MFEKYEKNINEKKDLPEINFTEIEIKDELINKQRWKNRRRLSWLSFLLITLIIFYTAYYPEITQTQADIFKYFGFFLSSIILTYIGGNVIEKVKSR